MNQNQFNPGEALDEPKPVFPSEQGADTIRFIKPERLASAIVEAGISIDDWLEAEQGPPRPKDSVTVAEYAVLRHWGTNSAAKQKARRVLEGMVERRRATRTDTKPHYYNLITPAMVEKQIDNAMI